MHNWMWHTAIATRLHYLRHVRVAIRGDENRDRNENGEDELDEDEAPAVTKTACRI